MPYVPLLICPGQMWDDSLIRAKPAARDLQSQSQSQANPSFLTAVMLQSSIYCALAGILPVSLPHHTYCS